MSRLRYVTFHESAFVRNIAEALRIEGRDCGMSCSAKLAKINSRSLRHLIVGSLAGLLIAASGAGPALAKPSTKERVGVLETEVAELRAAAAAAAASSQRIDQLEEEIRSLTGRIETLSYELDQANARLRSMGAALAGEPGATQFPGDYGDNGYGAPGYAGPSAGPTDLLSGPAEPAVNDPVADQSAVAASGSETFDDVQLPLDGDAAFAYANGFLLRQDFARAEAAFNLFLGAFGTHPRAPDAEFRLGEIFLAREKNAEAADTFVSYIRKYPNGGRAAEAYLKLGAAFAGLDQKDEACKVLRAVKTTYPNASTQVLDRAERELSRHGCR